MYRVFEIDLSSNAKISIQTGIRPTSLKVGEERKACISLGQGMNEMFVLVDLQSETLKSDGQNNPHQLTLKQLGVSKSETLHFIAKEGGQVDEKQALLLIKNATFRYENPLKWTPGDFDWDVMLVIEKDRVIELRTDYYIFFDGQEIQILKRI